MSVEKNSKHRPAINRLPLSNVTNTYSTNNPHKVNHQTPLYSFRNTYIGKSKEIKNVKLVPHKSVELKGSKVQNKSIKWSK